MDQEPTGQAAAKWDLVFPQDFRDIEVSDILLHSHLGFVQVELEFDSSNGLKTPHLEGRAGGIGQISFYE